MEENVINLITSEVQIISFSEDTCCLCLDNKCNLRLLCCRNKMHRECLFAIFLKGMYECPLCRKNHNAGDYFTINEFYMMLYDVECNDLDFKKSDFILLDILGTKNFSYYYHKMYSRLVKSKFGLYVGCCENLLIFGTIIGFYCVIFLIITLLYL